MRMLERFAVRVLRRLERRPTFAGADVQIGKNVVFGRNVVFNSQRVRIGDGTIFGNDVVVNSTTFEIGDYGTIYDHCLFPGPGELSIGHNFWLGASSIVDAQGGTLIGSNVGIGAHSQLWTHMIFGDTLAGSRFRSVKPLRVGDDAWLVGHCLVSPVSIGERALAMLGSVVIRDMEPDRCYGGVPARDITDRVGPPFDPTGPEQRAETLRAKIEEFAVVADLPDLINHVGIVMEAGEMFEESDHWLVFNVQDRTYRKTGTDLERQFIRFLLPEAKFTPGKAE